MVSIIASPSLRRIIVSKVTIAMSFYNDEKTLAIAIKSILYQSYSDWNLILLDDGSTDDSLKVAREFKDSRICVYSDGINKGLAPRLNEIVHMAKGKYIARMDADDIMHPERLKLQVEYLDKHKDIDVVGTEAYSVDRHNRILGKRMMKPIPQKMADVFKGSIFIHPTIMGKITWFENNLYEEGVWAVRAEDYELWCRSFRYSKFAVISSPLLFYRETSSLEKDINNYLKSYNSMMNVIDRTGSELPYWEKINLKIRNKLKCKLYSFVYKVGIAHLLLSKRYEGISVTEKMQMEKLIKCIEKYA